MKTLFFVAICILSVKSAVAQEITNDDSLLFLMNQEQKEIILQSRSEINNLMGLIHQQAKEDYKASLKCNYAFGDTSYYYEYKNIRIDKYGRWIILTTDNLSLDKSFDYFYFEKDLGTGEFSHIKKDECLTFNIIENHIFAEHFIATKGEHHSYDFDGYMKNKSYVALISELKSFQKALRKSLIIE